MEPLGSGSWHFRGAALLQRKSYDAELEDLERHYRRVLDWDVGLLRSALLRVAGAPALFVGTGGTVAVARLAAQLHERVGGQAGRVVTPLELASVPPTSRSGVVLFSAGLKHPDALAALEQLASSRLQPAVVVTLRDPRSLGEVVAPDVALVGLPSLDFREGFLATTSVLVMMSAIVRAYTGDDLMPGTLPRPQVAIPASIDDHLLVLTTPGLAPVATDIETRCHELGLAAVQVTDYRNLAHGRHVGLARRAASTTVVGLVAEPFEKLAAATLRTLSGAEIDVFTWRAQHSGPVAALELLLASMELTGSLARAQGVNAARPGAAPFGRRLYHLGLRRLIPPIEDGPVARKLIALASGMNTGAPRDMYTQALKAWLDELAGQTFAGVVLDYDGTVCSTGTRTELPKPVIQAALLRLLNAGADLGFASGRGKSLHTDLRAWVPRSHWPMVTVGLYNGGEIRTLDEELPDLAIPGALMRRAERRLRQLPFVTGLEIESRSTQVTLTVAPGAYAQVGRLSELIANAMSRSPAIPVKTMISGHSVDLVPRPVTKLAVADRIAERRGSVVLCIGDQGDVGGNDFELLAGTAWTLTVDRCSADPTRCWYLDTHGRHGPELLGVYLEAITMNDGGLTLSWPRP